MDPISYPNIIEGATLNNGASGAILTGNANQTIEVKNPLNIPDTTAVVVEWNDNNAWIVTQSEPHNTPVRNVV
jgi:hypothetical protein